jgi:hypothetical protein
LLNVLLQIANKMGLQKMFWGKLFPIRPTMSQTNKQTLQTEGLPTSAPTSAVLAEVYIQY